MNKTSMLGYEARCGLELMYGIMCAGIWTRAQDATCVVSPQLKEQTMSSIVL